MSETSIETRLRKIEAILFENVPRDEAIEDAREFIKQHHVFVKVMYTGISSGRKHVRTKTFRDSDSLGFMILSVVGQLQTKLIPSSTFVGTHFSAILSTYDFRLASASSVNTPYLKIRDGSTRIKEIGVTELHIEKKSFSDPELLEIASWWKSFFTHRNKSTKFMAKRDGRTTPEPMQDVVQNEEDSEEEKKRDVYMEIDTSSISSSPTPSRKTKRVADEEDRDSAPPKSREAQNATTNPIRMLDDVFDHMLSFLDKNDDIHLLQSHRHFDSVVGKQAKDVMFIDTARKDKFISLSTWVAIALNSPALLYLFPRVVLDEAKPSYVVDIRCGLEDAKRFVFQRKISFTDFFSLLFPSFIKYVTSVYVRPAYTSFWGLSPNPVLQAILRTPSKVTEFSYDLFMDDEGGNEEIPYFDIKSTNLEQTTDLVINTFATDFGNRTYDLFVPEIQLSPNVPAEFIFRPQTVNMKFDIHSDRSVIVAQCDYLSALLSVGNVQSLRVYFEVSYPLADRLIQPLEKLFAAIRDCSTLKSLYYGMSLLYFTQHETEPEAFSEFTEFTDQATTTACSNKHITRLQVKSANLHSLTAALDPSSPLTSIDFALHVEQVPSEKSEIVDFFKKLSILSSIHSLRFETGSFVIDGPISLTEVPSITSLSLGISGVTEDDDEKAEVAWSFLSCFPNVAYLTMHSLALARPQDDAYTARYKTMSLFFQNILAKIGTLTRLKTLLFFVEYLVIHRKNTNKERMRSLMQGFLSNNTLNILDIQSPTFPPSLREIHVLINPSRDGHYKDPSFDYVSVLRGMIEQQNEIIQSQFPYLFNILRYKLPHSALSNRSIY